MYYPGAFSVIDYNAVGDGITLDTQAVQKAIDHCSESGGGTVLFPAGHRFLIGTIYLKSHITLHIAENAAILGSTDLRDYTKDTGRCPYYPEPLDRCLIYAKGAEGIRFTGPGTVDGQFREDFQDKHDDPLKTDTVQRPMLIRLVECRDVQMKDLTLKGAFSWCVHLKQCENVKLRGMTVLNDRQDGFNIESSRTVAISDCTLQCGDDGIALTTSRRDAPLKDLTVTNCVITSRWAAVRLGPLSKGNFENIVITGCVLKNCGGGGIKIGMFEGAEIRNCVFSSLVMDNVTAPVLIMNARWTDIGSTEKDPPMMPPGTIRDLVFSDLIIHAHAGPTLPWDRNEYTEEEVRDFLVRPDRNSTIFLQGHRDGIMENLTFRNITLTLPGGGKSDAEPFENLTDMHEIDIHEHGYWTDDKTIWGIPRSSALFVRHGRDIRCRDWQVRYRKPEGRPSFAFSDSQVIELESIRIDGQKLGTEDVICRECRETGIL